MKRTPSHSIVEFAGLLSVLPRDKFLEGKNYLIVSGITVKGLSLTHQKSGVDRYLLERQSSEILPLHGNKTTGMFFCFYCK